MDIYKDKIPSIKVEPPKFDPIPDWREMVIFVDPNNYDNKILLGEIKMGNEVVYPETESIMVDIEPNNENWGGLTTCTSEVSIFEISRMVDFNNYHIFKDNCHFYSTEDLLDSLEEECAELIKECSKYKRTKGRGPITPRTTEEVLPCLIEEIADAYLTLESIVYKLGISPEEIIKICDEKIELVADRIEEYRKERGDYE